MLHSHSTIIIKKLKIIIHYHKLCEMPSTLNRLLYLVVIKHMPTFLFSLVFPFTWLNISRHNELPKSYQIHNITTNCSLL